MSYVGEVIPGTNGAPAQVVTEVKYGGGREMVVSRPATSAELANRSLPVGVSAPNPTPSNYPLEVKTMQSQTTTEDVASMAEQGFLPGAKEPASNGVYYQTWVRQPIENQTIKTDTGYVVVTKTPEQKVIEDGKVVATFQGGYKLTGESTRPLIHSNEGRPQNIKNEVSAMESTSNNAVDSFTIPLHEVKNYYSTGGLSTSTVAVGAAPQEDTNPLLDFTVGYAKWSPFIAIPMAAYYYGVTKEGQAEIESGAQEVISNPLGAPSFVARSIVAPVVVSAVGAFTSASSSIANKITGKGEINYEALGEVAGIVSPFVIERLAQGNKVLKVEDLVKQAETEKSLIIDLPEGAKGFKTVDSAVMIRQTTTRDILGRVKIEREPIGISKSVTTGTIKPLTSSFVEKDIIKQAEAELAKPEIQAQLAEGKPLTINIGGKYEINAASTRYAYAANDMIGDLTNIKGTSTAVSSIVENSGVKETKFNTEFNEQINRLSSNNKPGRAIAKEVMLTVSRESPSFKMGGKTRAFELTESNILRKELSKSSGDINIDIDMKKTITGGFRDTFEDVMQPARFPKIEYSETASRDIYPGGKATHNIRGSINTNAKPPLKAVEVSDIIESSINNPKKPGKPINFKDIFGSKKEAPKAPEPIKTNQVALEDSFKGTEVTQKQVKAETQLTEAAIPKARAAQILKNIEVPTNEAVKSPEVLRPVKVSQIKTQTAAEVMLGVETGALKETQIKTQTARQIMNNIKINELNENVDVKIPGVIKMGYAFKTGLKEDIALEQKQNLIQAVKVDVQFNKPIKPVINIDIKPPGKIEPPPFRAFPGQQRGSKALQSQIPNAWKFFNRKHGIEKPKKVIKRL